MADDDKPTLTRRRVLGGMATIGAAGAVGAGTTAYLNDEEKTGDLTFAGGEVDLQVDYTFTYSHDSGQNQNGTLDGSEAFTCDLTDIKPGDEITLVFCPHVEGNPSYLQVSGEIAVDDEGDNNEAEPDNDGSGGELDDALQARLKYKNDGTVIKSTRSLREMMNALAAGIKLDEVYGDNSEPCIVLVITLPGDTGNEIQDDSVTFEMMFNAEQKRNNSNPFSGGSGGGSGGGGTS